VIRLVDNNPPGYYFSEPIYKIKHPASFAVWVFMFLCAFAARQAASAPPKATLVREMAYEGCLFIEESII
jgi:hypothetical protein